MADLNDIEQIQASLRIIRSSGRPNLYFEDFLFKIVNFAQNRMLEGSGSPEGVVDAPRRSEYFDTAAPPGSNKYYKTTEAGNTGWVLI